MSSEGTYSLGIDPGWKNLGIALLVKNEDGVRVCCSGVLNPSECESKFGSRWAVAEMLEFFLARSNVDYDYSEVDILRCAIERYVPYAGIDTAEAENIQLTTGAFAGLMHDRYYSEIHMHRAFDWKRKLCQYLVRTKGFTNPSSSFDKKYSMAAAKACLDFPHEFKTDHEGDAIALAFTNFIE